MNYNLNSGYGMQLAHLLPQGFAGKVFMVAKSAAAGRDMLQQIFIPDPDGVIRYAATIDAAIGYATAARGDLILVAPGHTETVTAASGITLDVSGVSVIGLGNGNNRPVITFGTSTGASFDVTADNCKVKNIVGLAGIDGLTKAFNVTGDNCELDIEWQDASTTVEAATAVRLDTANNSILNLKYLGFTGGNATTSAVKLDDCDNVRINIDAYGVVSTAWVDMVDVASTNVRVDGTMYTQGISNFTRDVVDTITGSTWSATIFDASFGGWVSGGSASALASDDVSAVAALLTVPTADVVTNTNERDVIGNKTDAAVTAVGTTKSIAAYAKGLVTMNTVQSADATNNAFAGDVVGNKTDAAVSVVGTTKSLMAYIKGLINFSFSIPQCVEKSDGAVLSGDDDLFVITGGPIQILQIVGIVTTSIGAGTTNAKLTITTTEPAATVDMNAAAVDIDADAAGTSYRSINTTAIFTPVTAGFVMQGNAFATNDTQFLAPIGTIKFNSDAARAGVIKWYLRYVPLSPNSRVAAAA